MNFVAGLVRETIILIIPQNTTEVWGQEIVVKIIASLVSGKDECWKDEIKILHSVSKNLHVFSPVFSREQKE